DWGTPTSKGLDIESRRLRLRPFAMSRDDKPIHTYTQFWRRRSLVTFTVLRAFAILAALCLFSVNGPAAERPSVMGRNAGVSAGHPLTTAAAFEVLARGGNAIDAGVAALLGAGGVEQ